MLPTISTIKHKCNRVQKKSIDSIAIFSSMLYIHVEKNHECHTCTYNILILFLVFFVYYIFLFFTSACSSFFCCRVKKMYEANKSGITIPIKGVHNRFWSLALHWVFFFLNSSTVGEAQ
jgi:hypothetical protein